MPSPLAEYALRLNQKTNDYICSYFVSWNEAEKQIKSEQNRKRLRVYNCFLCWLMLAVVPCSTFVLILKMKYPQVLELRHAMVVLVSLLGCLMGLFLDSTFLLTGNELVKTLNYTIRSEHKFGVVYSNKKAGLRQFALGKKFVALN